MNKKVEIMQANIGSTDKAIRLIISLVLVILFYKGTLIGIVGVAALIIALILTVTSLISYSPIYGAFKLDTTYKEKNTDRKTVES